MVGEIVVLAMLEYEYAVFIEHIAIQHEVRNLGQLLQCVWWVGKDEVILLLVALQEAEYIATDQEVFVFTKFLEALADKVGVVAVGFHTYHSATAS